MQPTNNAMRHNMILGQIYTNEITDKRILNAMNVVPREMFLPEVLRGAAYVDDDLEVAPGRYMIAPLTLARLIDLAAVTPSCRILNIGCWTGYSAAVLACVGGHVVAVDSDPNAIAQARDHLQNLKLTNVNLQVVRAMNDGYAMSAPYDVIVVAGAIAYISEKLGSQLSVGGRLTAVRKIAEHPASKSGLGRGLLVTRLDHKLQYREHFDASCPLLPGFEAASTFSF